MTHANIEDIEAPADLRAAIGAHKRARKHASDLRKSIDTGQVDLATMEASMAKFDGLDDKLADAAAKAVQSGNHVIPIALKREQAAREKLLSEIAIQTMV